MGEAKRRRAGLGMDNNELRAGLLRLHEETKGKLCFDVTILRPEYAMRALLGGDTEAFEVVRQFGMRVNSGKRPLCLACDHQFRPGEAPPAAFSRCTPFLAEPSGALIVGICVECAKMPDEKLLEITAGWFRKLGIFPVAAGTA
jgi:hypothetical protein